VYSQKVCIDTSNHPDLHCTPLTKKRAYLKLYHHANAVLLMLMLMFISRYHNCCASHSAPTRVQSSNPRNLCYSLAAHRPSVTPRSESIFIGVAVHCSLLVRRLCRRSSKAREPTETDPERIPASTMSINRHAAAGVFSTEVLLVCQDGDDIVSESGSLPWSRGRAL